jgi:hypothetical protein
MHRTVALFLLFIVTACESHEPKPPPKDPGPELALTHCWDAANFKVGRVVSGRALAFYNPDGPLLVGDACEKNSLIASFSNTNLENRTLDRMRAESSGRVYGGAFFEVIVRGRVIKDREGGPPLHGLGLSVDQFTVGEEISPPNGARNPFAPAS